MGVRRQHGHRVLRPTRQAMSGNATRCAACALIDSRARAARAETPPAGRTAGSSSRRRPTCTCRPARGRTGCGSVPFSRMISARSTRRGSLMSSAPPSPQVKFFVSWKLCVAERAERAEVAAAVACRTGRARCPRPPAMPCARAIVEDRVHLARRRRRSAPATIALRARRDQRARAALVEVQRVGPDVDEHRPRAAQHERVGRRDERERRARSPRRPGCDVEQQRRHLERVRARGRRQEGLGRPRALPPATRGSVEL